MEMMAAVVGSAVSSLFGTGTAAAAGTAAATGGTAAAAGGSFLSTLSTGLTMASGVMSIIGGFQQAGALEQQAKDEELRAVQEEVNGREDALKALRVLNKNEAQIAVAGYASGLTSQGTVEQARKEAARIGDENMSTARVNAAMSAAARRGQAKQIRAEKAGAIMGGFGQAFSMFGDLAMSRGARG